MNEDVKIMESYVIAGPTGRIENGKHAKNIDKKGKPEFLIIFFCCRCDCLCMYQCMKVAEFKGFQFGIKIIKIS